MKSYAITNFVLILFNIIFATEIIPLPKSILGGGIVFFSVVQLYTFAVILLLCREKFLEAAKLHAQNIKLLKEDNESVETADSLLKEALDQLEECKRSNEVLKDTTDRMSGYPTPHGAPK
jgi:hypothetical protein